MLKFTDIIVVSLPRTFTADVYDGGKCIEHTSTEEISMLRLKNQHDAINFCKRTLMDYLAERREVSAEPQKSIYFCSADVITSATIKFVHDGRVHSFKSEKVLNSKICHEIVSADGETVYRYVEDFILAKGPQCGWLSCWFTSRDGLEIDGVCLRSNSSQGRATDCESLFCDDPDTRLDIYEKFIECINTAAFEHEMREGVPYPGARLDGQCCSLSRG